MVFFAHLLILEDPYRHQNLNQFFIVQPRIPPIKFHYNPFITFRIMFTDRQINATKNITFFCQGGTLLRSGGNYHHSMFHNPTAAVNLFHVGKQYLTLCKAKAAVTRNLIGRKIISNVKHANARNSLPILDVIRSSHKRHSASEYCK